jgi:hypothetical protein
MWGIPVNKIEGGIGELSDGYHSFNDLYRQRCVLFASLCNTFKDLSWKSRRHSDGQRCFGGGWFIVGIDTPQGQYTYHYEDKDWDMFDVEELEVARKFDGHTSNDVERLLSLGEIYAKRVVVGLDLASGPDTSSTINIESATDEEERDIVTSKWIEIDNKRKAGVTKNNLA